MFASFIAVEKLKGEHAAVPYLPPSVHRLVDDMYSLSSLEANLVLTLSGETLHCLIHCTQNREGVTSIVILHKETEKEMQELQVLVCSFNV